MEQRHSVELQKLHSEEARFVRLQPPPSQNRPICVLDDS